MKDEITLSGNELRKYAERVFDCAYKLAIKQVLKEIESGFTENKLTQTEYKTLRAKSLAGFKVV